MKIFPFILLVMLYSCSPGEWTEYKFEIKNINQLSKQQIEETNHILLNKLNKFGFRESKLRQENQYLIVETLINSESQQEVSYFKSIFESTRLEHWDTYKISDRVIAEIDTSLLRENFFTPYSELSLGFYPEEVLGICKDKTKLNEVLNNLTNKTNHVENLKLFWSEEMKNEQMGAAQIFEDKHYRLYMINDNGSAKAPLTDNDIVQANASLDEYRPGSYAVNFGFSKEGAKKWAKMTERAANNGNRSIAIVFNDRVQVVPRVMSAIHGGRSSISNELTKEEAEKYARAIEIGRLDYKLKFIGESVIESKN